MSVKITILVEGATESAFKEALVRFLKGRLLAGKMPLLDFSPQDGRLPKEAKLRRMVENLLGPPNPSDAVIALTDVYTGTKEFATAADAKRKMREWVGAESRFYPQVALHDFEAWLLPYWPEIKRLAGSNRKAPAASPESVNHDQPPAHLLAEVFRTGEHGKKYIKPRDGRRILRDQDLNVSAQQCSELKSFLNVILTVSGGEPI